jgi:hypothetical protein
MKTLPAVVAALVCMACLQMAHAQITVGTSDPTQGNCYPFMCNDSGASSGPTLGYQQVYASSAFPSMPVIITSETFYYQSLFGGSDTLLGGTYQFYLSTTSAPVGGLDPTLANNLGPDNTPVLTETIPAGGVPFGTSFTFVNSTPFSYNPSLGNLLLDVVASNQDNIPDTPGFNSYMETDTSGLVTSRAFAFLGSATGIADAVEGLVTTFTFNTPVPEPSAFLPLLGLLGVGWLSCRKLRR